MEKAWIENIYIMGEDGDLRLLTPDDIPKVKHPTDEVRRKLRKKRKRRERNKNRRA